MTGGLLEKAKQKIDDDEEGAFSATGDSENPDFKKESKILDGEPSGGGGGLLSKAASGEEKDPTDKPILLYAAAGSLLACMVLIYFMYLIEIPFIGVLVLILLIGSGYIASLHVSQTKNDGGSLTRAQWGTLVVSYLLLAAIPYVGAMNFGGSILMTFDELDEQSDTVTLTLRHSAGLFGSEFTGDNVDVTVSQDGSETWSETVNVAMTSGGEGNTGTITLAIADFYSMNAQRVKSFTGTGAPVMEDHPYTVCVDVDGASGCTDLPIFELTRSVTDVDELAAGYDDGSEDDGQGGTDCEGNHESCIDYIEIQGWVGEGSASTDSNTIPSRIRGVYQINMTFAFEDGTPTIDYATISVVGTVATWDDDLCGSGPMTIGDTTTEFFFPCGGDNRFDNDDALEPGYGCYTLTVSTSQGGEDVASSSSHYEYTEESDEGEDEFGNPAGTYYWEEFNAVDSC